MNITPSDQENVRQNIQKYSNKIAKTLENQKPTTQPTRDVEWYKEYCNLASNMLLEKHHRGMLLYTHAYKYVYIYISISVYINM